MANFCTVQFFEHYKTFIVWILKSTGGMCHGSCLWTLEDSFGESILSCTVGSGTEFRSLGVHSGFTCPTVFPDPPPFLAMVLIYNSLNLDTRTQRHKSPCYFPVSWITLKQKLHVLSLSSFSLFLSHFTPFSRQKR